MAKYSKSGTGKARNGNASQLPVELGKDRKFLIKEVLLNESWARTVILEPYHEVRLEVDGEPVYVGLQSGTAEFFGTELTTKKRYKFEKYTRLAIFTYHGCVLKLDGPVENNFVSGRTPMTEYINTHQALEQKRQSAKSKGERGPVVMVVGHPAVGKSTLCRILVNYAVRKGRTPLYVDLDVGQNAISVPGTIASAVMRQTACVEKGFVGCNTLVYHFGHTKAEANDELYKQLVANMAEKSMQALKGNNNQKTKISGVIINTSGWVKGEGYTQILNTAKAFEVDTILVLEKEQLHKQLSRDLPSNVTVAHLSKSDGVEPATTEVVLDNLTQCVKNYFYGDQYRLHPHTYDIKFEDMNLFKIAVVEVPQSCVPHGVKVEGRKMTIVPVELGPHLRHHILAVNHAKGLSPDLTTIETPTKGFLCITNVDMTRKVVTILSPEQKPVLRHVLLLSDLRFDDSHA